VNVCSSLPAEITPLQSREKVLKYIGIYYQRYMQTVKKYFIFEDVQSQEQILREDKLVLIVGVYTMEFQPNIL
jgi:hypothetical protein